MEWPSISLFLEDHSAGDTMIYKVGAEEFVTEDGAFTVV